MCLRASEADGNQETGRGRNKEDSTADGFQGFEDPQVPLRSKRRGGLQKEKSHCPTASQALHEGEGESERRNVLKLMIV